MQPPSLIIHLLLLPFLLLAAVLGELIRSCSDAICQSQSEGGAQSQEVRTLTAPRLSLPSLSKQTNCAPRDALTYRQNMVTTGWTQLHEHLAKLQQCLQFWPQNL